MGTLGRASDDGVTRPFSLAYKQKMLERMTGKDRVSGRQLARDTGISQETLSRWYREAHSLPLMTHDRRTSKRWSIDGKVRVLAQAAKLARGGK